MTPFEELGYKVGDRFRVKRDGLEDWGLNEDSVVTLVEDDGSESPYFRDERGRMHCFFLGLIKPVALKTESQTRNAALGTGITFKPTGAKGVFWKSSHSVLGEEWYLLMADGNILTTTPSQIRLDHEPEYREIPFYMATHEQRMDHKNILWDGHAGAFSEVLFTHANTYILTVRSKVLPLIYTTQRTDGHTNPTGLTVRIPA